MRMIYLLFYLLIVALAINANHGRLPRQNGNCPSSDNVQNRQGYRVENYTVHTTVKTRFACTKVYGNITNTGTQAKQLCFTVTLPEKAFISNLCMEVDGKNYRGIIEEKMLAKIMYNSAIESKFTVGLVESVDGRNQKFEVCSSVRAYSSAFFSVEYKQLLIMELGRIEHRIPIESGQNANHIQVSVEYEEPQGIRTIQSSNGVANVSEGGSGLYSYIQSQNNQSQNCHSNPDNELVVTYEPIISNSVTTYVANYTFLQFFSPTYSLCLDINLIVLLDISVAMRPSIDQVKIFLEDLMYELTPGDNFNIIAFNTIVSKFSNSLVGFDRTTRRRALYFIRNLAAGGGTNIDKALVAAGEQISAAFQSDPSRANLIFLISDGRTNKGELDPIKIDRNFRNAKLETPVILHTFLVGQSANDRLLKRLTILNGGKLYHIGIDGLTNELLDITINELGRACPLLSNIKFNYPDDSVEDLTLTSFPYFIKGQELIVSGRILQGAADVIHMNITGDIRGGRSLTWRRSISLRLAHESQNSYLSETMLAYLIVREKNQEYIFSNDDNLKDEIVNISKRYHFVTSLTSLLVSETLEESHETCACQDEFQIIDLSPLSTIESVLPFRFIGNTIPNSSSRTRKSTPTLYRHGLPGPPSRRGSFRRRRSSRLPEDCPMQGLNIPSNWLNVSQCRGVGNAINSHSVQVRCRIDNEEDCRDYWIRSIDCNTGDIEYISSLSEEPERDQRCLIWYDVREDILRCSSRLEMLHSLFQLEVFLCPISEEANRGHHEYIEYLYRELESADETACTYELGSCMLA